jgi:iron complex outermembrane recepter protein
MMAVGVRPTSEDVMKSASPYVLTAVIAAISAATPAMAQSPEAAMQPPVAGDEEVAALEEIVVTARRREENLQEVPISVTAFSPETLAEMRIADRTDLANFTPSLISITGGYPKEFAFFALRGQGPAFGSVPGTYPYFAEVANAITIDGRVGTYHDLANVQVLAGPQGTLFGKNATGGNILFEPQRPTNNFGGYVQGEIGNLENRRAEFALNVPIVDDRVLFRIAGERGVREGYTKDVGPIFNGKDYDNLDYGSLRASLILRPTETIELYTVARAYKSENNGTGTVLTQFNPALGAEFGFPAVGLFPGLATAVAEQRARGPRRVAYDLDQYSDTEYWQIINHATIKLGDNLTLKNIISYSEFEQSYGYDYDATIFPIAGQRNVDDPNLAPTFFTEELQLQGQAFDGALDFVLGGYYDKADQHRETAGLFTQFPISLLIGPIPASFESTAESRALFAQGTLDLASVGLAEGLSLTAGYRYTWEEIGTAFEITGVSSTSGQAEFDYGSYNLTLDYAVTPDVHVYGTIRDAYKAGGVNGPVPEGSPFRTFPPEHLEDVEVGLKSQFRVGDVGVRANVAVYRGDYEDIQRTTAELVSGAILNVTRSAAKGRVQGAEFNGVLSPGGGLTFTGSYSYIDSEYTEVADASAGALLSGVPFPYTPKHKFALGVSWEHTLDGFGELDLSANLASQSSFSTAQNNLAQVRTLPGYETLSLRAALREVAGRPIDLVAFVANATDEEYASGLADFYNIGGGTVAYTYGEPRTYGVQVRYTF